MGLFHLCQIQTNSKWTMQNTADFFKVSTGLVSENLKLAELFADYPDLSTADTRKDALAKVEKRKFQRYKVNDN